MGKKFTEYSRFDLSEINKEVLNQWDKQDLFHQSLETREGCPSFVFYEGPPSANGMPGIHHVMARSIKDIFCRYKTMKGFHVKRKAGWDTHGLPVELGVEKALGITKEDIGKTISVADYNATCRKDVMKFTREWEDLTHRMGYWVDMKNPYITYDNRYIETLWWLLKQLYNKNYLYKGYTIQPYSPAAGTGLSSHELNQPGCYRDVKDTTCIAQFKIKNPRTEMTAFGEPYFLAWTTTPWTLPSNVALCVNPNDTYCKVKAADGYVYYMAEDLLDSVLGSLAKEEGEKAYEVLETYKGTDLEYKAYEPLFACAGEAAAKQKKKAHFVTCDNYVTMSDGTGIVHIAPAFGEDDSRIGRNYELPFVQFVDGQGNLTKETPYAGVFVKKADSMVLTDLDKEGKLFDAPKFEHDYPHCWRCDTPLIYYARESWFIKMTAVKDDLIRNNNTINWIPESIGKGRFGDWLENVQDWGISRNRYWGTPLNIWQCECGHMHSIGSRQELFEMSGDEKAKTVELHRPYIDEITLKCPECGGEMHRVPEVIDCWFDSGAMPFAQHHYPFENKELFEQQFPANFISEAVDQTRGWFYSLLAESTLLFNKAPYKNVIVLGHVQDENGQKMSKSKGNAVDPFDALNKYGADAIRWYFYINSAPWLPNRFHGKAVVEGQRKFMSTLWNTYAFFVLYADIDNFDPTKYELNYDQLPVMDKWLLSRLNTTVQAVDNDLANYKIPEAARALQEFVDEMSNWYVRRSRERFWAKGMEQDKINAYMTLYHALVTIAKTAAPMIPFMTEDIYQNLVRSVDKDAPESIHLCDFPTVNEAWIDKDLEADMKELLEIVVLGRACRNTANIKNRQPIGTMYVKAEKKMSEFYTDIIADELNVKEVKFADDVESFISYSFKPQLRTVGPKYGKLLGGIRQALTDINGTAAMNELRTNGVLKLDINGNDVELTEEDLLIETAQTEGYVSESDGETSVVLDTNLTPELIEEGFVREIISKIQTMRKDAGFEVMDKIVVYAHGNDKIQAVMKTHEAEIKSEVLADEMVLGETDGYVKEWNINKEAVTMGVKKL